MLSYQDVVTVKLGTLMTAATDWEDMAGGFEELETLYAAKVESAATEGTSGLTAAARAAQLEATREQFKDAQTEARAIASILREAHLQFSKLIGHVHDVVDQVKADHMSVNSQGEAVYDFRKLTPMRHDEDYPKYVSRAKDAEAAWTKKIKDAVQAVDDADEGVKHALYEAAGIKSWIQRALDPFNGMSHTFNGSAVGDIEVYEAREAKGYANVILAGDKLDGDDLKEWQRLMRENSHDKVFSQTLLNSLGADKTLKLTNKIDDLAYYDDTKDKNAYLQINGGLADSLATATRVPDFKDANGKHLPFGSKGYNDAFDNWLRTDDAQFYIKWGNDLREHGVDKYDLKVAGEKIQMVTKGHGQQVRGYQSLVTLMQQGHGYSPQFLADVTDGAIATEKDHPNIWDLYGSFSDKSGDGWFANDPVDGALGIMGRDPEAAAGYLDPHAGGTDDRLHYLLKDRDWKVVNTTDWQGNREIDTSDVQDTDDRRGLGDALTAAATGIDPHGSRPVAPTSHTDANNRVFVHALDILSQQGDDMPSSLRDDMAKIMANHGHETYVAMSDPSGRRHPDVGPTLDQKQVMEITKQISRSQNSYGLLHEGMNYAIMDDIHDKSRRPEDTLSSAGYAVGFMEDGRYAALKDNQHDYTWDKAWSYHALGGALNFIPVYGDAAQRGADVLTSAWIMDEQKHQADKLTSDSQQTYYLRRNQLNSIADQWYSANSDWASSHPGYSHNDGVYKQIEGWANDGGAQFRGMAGIH
ncbi:hypothetical protein GQF42_34990 [Streptomyces broussonetiae]|uniref:Uncharacterized protein n=1 Tax=Streptomyces broussonetiae TaxID=2686304 RepID=A0A6I6NFT5_9ACTN|nr:hypothetical protein [Streptomyces broussonetiae]QHA07815.1 hypothetical protein GQF42_34990 [Streptomyces broussonetiae]